MNTYKMILATLVAAALASPVSAQYLRFTRPTDTVLVDGQLVLGTAVTYEARVMLTDPLSPVEGIIFNEWAGGLEDKSFHFSPHWIFGSAIGLSVNALSQTRAIELNRWHHVSWVYDGAEIRLYLDGAMIAASPSSGSIANAEGQLVLGARFRDKRIMPAFIGLMDTVRISSVARYSGPSFTPPEGDLPPDPDTLLLFNFDDPSGSGTVRDASTNHFVGTFGVGFDGATPPALVRQAVPGTPVATAIAHAVAVSFLAESNQWYQVQVSSVLDTNSWADFGPPILGDGLERRVFDSAVSPSRKFYRVLMLQEGTP